MNRITITNTLKAIRDYKNGIGNYFDFIDAIDRDATEYVGMNPGIALCQASKSGNQLSADEKNNFQYAYRTALKDAISIIFDRVYKVTPSGIKNCKYYKENALHRGGNK